jgi:hypothetical protein
MLILALAAPGCGEPLDAPAPPPLANGRSTSTDGDAKSDEKKNEQLDEVVVAPPQSSTFSGELAATSTVPFGGSPFCKYDITLRDVAIEIEIAPSGDVTRATVRNRGVEQALESCPYAPMEPSAQEFTFASAVVTTTGTRVQLTGATTNEPATALVLDLVQSGAGYEATATWKRTDIQAPLDWSVSATVSLARK